MTIHPETDRKPCRPSARKNSPGFTLLEILVAILLFSIVVTTVFGSFRAMHGRADVVNGSLRMDQTALACLHRIGRDLRAIYAHPVQLYREPDLDKSNDPYRLVGDEQSVGGKTFSRLRFSSTAHIPFGSFPEEGVARITYYVVVDPDGFFSLRRSDRLHPPEEFEQDPWDPVLCPFVESLIFTYFDAEGDAYEKWDTDDEDNGFSLPAAVGVQLKLRQGSTERSYRTKVTLAVSREAAS